MTKLYKDILGEPIELSKSLTYTLGDGRAPLDKAANILNSAEHIYVVGIGSSWNAGLAVLSFFSAAGRPAILCDASELLHFGDVAENAAVVVLSRSGKSTEIVKLLPKFASRRAKIVAITNTPDSLLAQQAHVVLKMMAGFDNAVSVSMYSVLAMIGGLLARAAEGKVDDSLAAELQHSITSAGARLGSWSEQISASAWMDTNASTYLLARGASLASCHEGRLLWEEAAKLPASAMSAGSFRHGPQEVIREGMRVILWIEREKMRAQDLALAVDLRKLGVKVLAIGQDLPVTAGDLVLQIPAIPAEWQFVLDIIPVQVAAECLSRAGNQDCDAFRLCQYIVEDEGGLIPSEANLAGVPTN
jgi:glutamine---fructose-6-phosphate transaminase (isomerizing)